jgi:leucyl-tRNA synthetase
MTEIVYDFEAIEAKWQKVWDKRGTFKAKDFAKPKMYILEMFPYASGDIHMGHIRNYAIGDAVTRYYIKKGFNVLHPMGFDSFGLPAEQAAIDRDVHPALWTSGCISNLLRQFKRAGYAYDWDRMVVTSDPDYYRWTQWIFIQLFKAGLVYKKASPVNWCPQCAIVLADEEVKEGLCWRCDSAVERRNLSQWFAKTTEFAQDLLDGIGTLEDWPERTRVAQTNWIGRSDGTRIVFPCNAMKVDLPVFTTRADTLMGVTYVVVAPEHPIVADIAAKSARKKEIDEFVRTARAASAIDRTAEGREKVGVDLGVTVTHPITGAEMPLWSADYVLPEYGTGAVMAVPGHDTRDHEFALKYGLPIVCVIGKREDGKTVEPELPFTDYGVMVNSGQFTGLSSGDGIKAVTDALKTRGLGGAEVQYKLRDWLLSRQRYWGAPIPVVHCIKCGWVPVKEDDLPVTLPEEVDFHSKGFSPLEDVAEFVNTTCPACGGEARRETDTLTTFMDSAWYFLRYCDPTSPKAAWDPAKVNFWLPVDHYIGGIEHAVGHLMYSRFITRVFEKRGLLNFKEPFAHMFHQGLLIKDGAKMSKSRGNVVAPDDMVGKYGADTARLFELFGGPPEQTMEWKEGGVEGCFRFLRRLHTLACEFTRRFKGAKPSDETRGVHPDIDDLLRVKHYTVREVTSDVEAWRFNTAVSRMMEMLNFLVGYHQRLSADVLNPVDAAALPSPNAERASLLASSLLTLASLLAPFAPHIAEEVWEMLGGEGLVANSPWEAYDESFLAADTVEYGVSVNGTPRDKVVLPTDASEDEIKAAALSAERAMKFTEGKTVVKVIVVKGRLVNIVVK